MRQAILRRLSLEPFTPKTLTTLDALGSAAREAASPIKRAIGGSAPQPAG
jgi:hypothetical protein